MSEKISLKNQTTEPDRGDSRSYGEKPNFSSAANSSYDISFLQRTIGNRAVFGLFQSGALRPKLKGSQPNDVYEQEADRVAEEVMNDKDSVRPITRSSANTVSRQGDERGEKAGKKPNEPKEEEKSSYGEKEAPTWAVPMKYRFVFSDEIQSFVDVTTNRTYSKSEMDRFLGDAEEEKKFCEKLIPVLERKLAELENLPLVELEKKEGVEIVNEAVYEVLQICVALKGEWVGGYTNWGDPYSEQFCAITISDRGNPFLVFPFWQHERVHQRECLRAIDEQKSKSGTELARKVAAAGKLAGAKVFVASDIEAYRTAVSEIQHEVESYRSGDYGKSGIAPVCAPETFSIQKQGKSGGLGQGAIEIGVEKGGNSEATTGLESRIRAMQGSGRPLSEPVRSYFEPRLGCDFSDVRVHTGEQATESARAINAKAFTFGNHIVFDQTEYSPDSLTGQRLLAHELTHVVQQNGGDFSSPSRAREIMREQTSGFVTEESSEATGASGVVAPEAPSEETLHGETYRYHLQDAILKLEGAAREATNDLFGRTVDGYCESLEGTLLEHFVPFPRMVWLPRVTQAGFDATYWRYEIDCMTPKVQLLQKAGKPSEAIDEMFAHLGRWTFDCAEYLQVAQWYAQRHTMGADAFDAKMTSLGGLTLRQHGSTGIVTSDLYFRAGPGEPFGRDNKIAQRSESTNLTEDEILAAAPVGTRVTWSNVAAPRSGEEGRGWWSFGNENTLKMGENSYAAHPFGTVSREDIECRLAASGYAEELKEAGLLPEPQSSMIRATLRQQCEEGRPGELLRDYVHKKIFISFIEFFKIE